MRLARALSLLLAVVPLACVEVPFDAPPGPGAGEGSLVAEPAAASASAALRMRLVFTAGPSGLADGGGFRVRFPVDPVHPFLGFTPPHVGPRHMMGHIRCSTLRGERSGDDAHAEAGPGGEARCLLDGGRLAPGESLVMEYRTLAPRVARSWRFAAWSRVTGGRGGKELARQPALEVTPRAARALAVVAPSVATAGGRMRLAIMALDEFGNPDRAYEGVVVADAGGGRLEHRFGPGEGGVAELETTAPEIEGFARFSVRETGEDPDLGLKATSNPIRIFPAAQPGSAGPSPVLWGDLDFATGEGAGGAAFLPPGEPAGDRRGNETTRPEAFAWARDVARLDFAAAAEYATRWLTDAAWDHCRETVRRFHDPPRFTVFNSFRWRDRLVLLPGDDAPLVRWDDRRGDDPSELMAVLPGPGNEGALLTRLPECADGRPTDAVEIYSWRNRGDGYEDRPRRFELSCLASPGPRAVTAGSGNHWGRPGTVSRTGLEPGSGGLTAVVAATNDRAAILGALRRGDAWATTGARIYLRVRRTAGGVEIEAAGSVPLIGVNLVTVTGSGRRETPVLPAGATDMRAVLPAPRADDAGFWYVRATQEDGQVAWSSPKPLREGEAP